MNNIEYSLIQVTTTVDDEQKANKIAKALLDAKLVACVQIFPVQSHYQWRGSLCMEPELLIQMKTCVEHFSLIQEWIEQNHPYDTPELIAFPIVHVSKSYLDWVMKVTA